MCLDWKLNRWPLGYWVDVQLLNHSGQARDDLLKKTFAFKIRWNNRLIKTTTTTKCFILFILKWVKFILLNCNEEAQFWHMFYSSFQCIYLGNPMYMICLILPQWENPDSFLCCELICLSLSSSIVSLSSPSSCLSAVIGLWKMPSRPDLHTVRTQLLISCS